MNIKDRWKGAFRKIQNGKVDVGDIANTALSKANVRGLSSGEVGKVGSAVSDSEKTKNSSFRMSASKPAVPSKPSLRRRDSVRAAHGLSATDDTDDIAIKRLASVTIESLSSATIDFFSEIETQPIRLRTQSSAAWSEDG